MTDLVTLELQDRIATVKLNDPENRNAFTEDLASAFEDCLHRLKDEPPRCVVIESAGSAFSAGGDIDAQQERIESESTPDEKATRLFSSIESIFGTLTDLRVPTVAKVDGVAVGAGAGLVLACDVILASVEARIGFSFRRVGLTVDAGTSYYLPRLVGVNHAKELVFTGRILSAEEAARLGIFNHVYPTDEFEDKSTAVITNIADGPTAALAHGKRLIDESFSKTWRQAIRDEAIAQALMYESVDHAEGVSSFIDKRDPEFEGR